MRNLISVLDDLRPWRVLDRPVFVVAAPRSGSTLLFDLLEAHPDIVSWPFEAHRAFELSQPADHPWPLGHRWPPEYADAQRRRALDRQLYLGRLRARAQAGLPTSKWERLAPRKVRLLEKTPASVVRFAALARMYPDARFVYLHRDAPASIGSLIEAWETPSAAHARVQLDGKTVNWMMLAPPGWIEMAEAPVPERAAFQWRAGTEFMLNELDEAQPGQVLRLSYEELVVAPEEHLRRVLEHCELSVAPEVLARAGGIGTAGRTSLSAPRPDKWRARAADIEPLLPDLAPLRQALGYEV